MMTTRSEQVASTLRRSVQSVISRGLQDPRIRGLISITNVDVSPDLRDARIHVSILPADHAALTLHGLTSAAAHIRTEAGRMMRIRTMPRLSFVLDESLKKQAAIESAIRDGLAREEAGDDGSQTSAAEGESSSQRTNSRQLGAAESGRGETQA